VVLSETPDRDPCAIRAEGCVFGRRHGHIVVHDDGTFHGPVCKLAEHTDALCLRPSAMDRVVRNQIRTDIYDANHLADPRGPRHRARREHVAFNVHSANDTAEVDRGLSRVPYMVSGNVCLDLCAGYSHTEYDDSR